MPKHSSSASAMPVDSPDQDCISSEEGKVPMVSGASGEYDLLDFSVKIQQCESWNILPELCAKGICRFMGAIDARWVEASTEGEQILWAFSSTESHAQSIQESLADMEARARELGSFYQEFLTLMQKRSDAITSLKTSLSPAGIKNNPYVKDFLLPVGVADVICIQLFHSASGSVVLYLGMADGEVSQKQLKELDFIRQHIRAACTKLSRLASFANLTDALKQRWQGGQSVGISVLSKDGKTLWETDDVSVKMLEDLGGEKQEDGTMQMPVEMGAWATSIMSKHTRICSQTGNYTMTFATKQGPAVNAMLLLERAGSGALLVVKRDRKSGQFGGIFTRRELDVICCITEGLTSQEASERLHISKRTVDKHLENVYAKLGVSNRISAIKRLEDL